MTFPEPHFVETNGIKMAIYEQGEKTAMPVVLCHGFPEIAYSWRHQLPAIADAGFRAIAPDQRGYGYTRAPKGEENIHLYDMEHLTADLVGMLDALNIEKAIFVGHDWGGFVSWQMPLRHPDRVAGCIGVNTPFLPRLPIDPIAAMRTARGEDMYIVSFQKFGRAEGIFDANVPRALRFWFRTSSKTLAEYDAQADEDAKNLAFLKSYDIDENLWGGQPVLTSEELAYYIEAFEYSGFEGGINWYRNFTRNWERSADIVEKVHVPCLMISAANDFVLRPSFANGMEQYCPDLEKHIIPDCSHWTQAEKPNELNALMVDWLTRRFG